jgi:spore coat protein A, manganese oxidase
MPPPNFPITVGGVPTPAVGYETGFKDTALCPPGQVTRVVADFRGAQVGRYVWHCHILEHEDHEMMRPYEIV